VARWDFTAEEVARRCRQPPHAEGIRLEMVWPGPPPVHDRLHLFVRYVTGDGRKLQTDRPIAVDVPGLEAQGPMPDELSDPMPESSQAASGWQGRPAAVTPLPALEPPPVSTPKRARPVWSPDRL
jgi:hypothetical protein